QDMGFDGLEDLIAAVGYSRITPRKVLNRLYAILHPEAAPEPEAPTPSVKESRESAKRSEGVSVAGVDGVLMRFAKCCNPVPGDPIIGYISRGMGITVHRADCPNVTNMEPERLVSVHWEGEDQKPYEAGIFIIARNVVGVLARVTEIFSANNVNITRLNMEPRVDGKAKLNFTVEVRNANELYTLIEAIRQTPDIFEVVRAGEDEA
ncbi:MAG: ACT domain-containing protein, partial [Desulfovibrio sp.]|nr:ACT domain-containing protein [Desulfovibrio sp.]